MRATALTLLLMALLASVASPAAAHEGGVDHGTLFSDSLASGASVTKHLDFEERPLIGGWVWLLGAKVQGGELEAELAIGATTVGAWTIPPAAEWTATTTLPASGVYNLTLRNPGSATVAFSVYFDQSCDCSGKYIPAEIPDGLVIFNVNTTAPSTVHAEFNEPRGMRIRVSAARLVAPQGRWPADFLVLATSENATRRQAGPAVPAVWLHILEFADSEAGRIYFFVEGLGLTMSNPTPADLLVTPLIEVRPDPGPAISPWILVAAAIALAATGSYLLWRRWPRRPA